MDKKNLGTLSAQHFDRALLEEGDNRFHIWHVGVFNRFGEGYIVFFQRLTIRYGEPPVVIIKSDRSFPIAMLRQKTLKLPFDFGCRTIMQVRRAEIPELQWTEGVMK